MSQELKVPEIGESVTEVQIGTWLVKEGDSVSVDQPLVEIESDKATVELPAPADGVIAKILVKSGSMAAPGDAIAVFEAGGSGKSSKGKSAAKNGADKPRDSDAKAAEDSKSSSKSAKPSSDKKERSDEDPKVMPAAARLLEEHGIEATSIEGSGPAGRITKEDAQRAIDADGGGKGDTDASDAGEDQGDEQWSGPERRAGHREEETVPMSMLRRRIAERLVEAQQNAALLTTFNEVDMSAAIALRKQHGEAFEKRHGVKLGFMSIFAKAAVDALRLVPAVNAEVRGKEIVYRHYMDIGVAVGGGRGLVVPVVRNAEALGFAEIEKEIGRLAQRARDNKLELEELQGGTFTISNGGIYGSLLSTPIVNPPQSGILGLHKIQDRAVVRDGQVVVRPMMYLALTYDHRIVDGREAVTFLKRVVECVEDPARMLVEV